MSKNEFSFNAEGSEASDQQKELKPPKIKRVKLADRDQKIVVLLFY